MVGEQRGIKAMRCPKKNIKNKGEIRMRKIGIAVFALMFAGLAYVGAQEIEIDFDCKSDIQKSQSINIAEAVKVSISDGVGELSELPMPGMPTDTDLYSSYEDSDTDTLTGLGYEPYLPVIPFEELITWIENNPSVVKFSGFCCNESDAETCVGMVCESSSDTVYPDSTQDEAELVEFLLENYDPYFPSVSKEEHLAYLNHKNLNNKKLKISYFKIKGKLKKIILDHYNKYPEFAESILPMLKDEKAILMVRDGLMSIINGNSIIKITGKITTDTEKAMSINKNLGLIVTGVQAAGAWYDVYNAWQEYSSWPPVPDSGTANDDTGSSSHSTYHSQGGNSNYDVEKSLK